MAERELMWTPSAERVANANITRYQRWLQETHGLRTETYAELWRWSVQELEAFWGSIADHFEVRFSTPPRRVLGDRAMPGADWFPGAELNYAAHIFRDRDPGALAIQYASELRPLDQWSWGELRSQAAAISHGLRRLGVRPGDRVAAYMPNIPETVAAFLACAAIGAVWSCAAPEFGASSVIDRFSQIEPVVVLAADGYRYGGRDFDRRGEAERIAAALPGKPRVVHFGHLAGSGWEPGFADGGEQWLECVPVPFEHPLWVLYSSGTTGLPKPIVHSQGGILLE
ncbi:MAG TPA: AMP-binding protein, partial [Solirubrobacteraceae bacterium]|nr:AMP-binding protein [Solirubrobacteraceae bacterium]